jgi:hypothetical protein
MKLAAPRSSAIPEKFIARLFAECLVSTMIIITEELSHANMQDACPA